MPASDDGREEPGRAEIDRLRTELEHARHKIREIERDRDRLRDQNERLKRQLGAARRAGFRQAAPFAKPLKRDPKRPGRRAGRAYGPKARRRIRPRIDEHHDVGLPAHCPACAGPIVETGVMSQYQEELPVARVVVRHFAVHIGRCTDCHRRVQGRHPPPDL